MRKIPTKKRYIPCGLSFPKEILSIIDEERGDINRSKYILKILEKTLPSEVSSFSEKVAAQGDQ